MAPLCSALHGLLPGDFESVFLTLFRLFAVPFVLLGAIILGVLISGGLESLTGVWFYFLAAVVIPSIGLNAVYVAAPWRKFAFVLGSACVGIILAFYLAFPSSYPEWHPRAYQPTYVPFLLVCITTVVHLFLLSTRRVRAYLAM